MIKQLLIRQKYIFFIILISFFFLFPLYRGFYISQDGEAHVARFAAYYQAFVDGQIPPRWAGNLNFGYGSPVFIFYYPLPGYIASILHFLGLHFETTYLVLIALCFISAPICFFIWARTFLTKEQAFVSALLYGFAPYHFLDLFVRGDIAELLAFVFLSLVFLAIDYCITHKSWKSIFLGSAAFGLVILSHNGVSLMFTPVLVLYAIVKIITHKQWKQWWRVTLLFILGFGLSSFFWVPALLEKKYVQASVFIGDMYKQHFPLLLHLIYSPWGFGPDVNKAGGLSPQVGIVYLLLVILGIYFFFKDKKKNIDTIFWIIIFLVGIFITIETSTFFWSKISLLQLYEFPWRFSGLTSFAAAMLGTFVLSHSKNTKVLFMLCGLFLLSCLPFIQVKGYVSHPDTYYRTYTGTTYYHGEASSIWTAGDPSQYPKASVEIIDGKGTISQIKKKSQLHNFLVTMSTNGRILDNTIYFPGWRVYVDNVFTTIQFQDISHRGLITFPVSQGTHTIKVLFKETYDRLLSDVVTLLAIIIIFFGILFSNKRFYLFKKNFMKKNLILLFFIFLLGTFLRFYQLNNFPVGFYRDEAFLGYNAYSLLLTGRDITGHVLPIHLASFLFSPAGYSYAAIPFIALFGLSAFSVRFASAFFGSITIILVYFFVKELFISNKQKNTHLKHLTAYNLPLNATLALLSAFFLAICPWHINLSRASTENILVIFFITLGLYSYLLWLRRDNWIWFGLSFFSFLLTLGIYQAPRAFLPLFLPCFFFLTLQHTTRKKLIASFIALVVVIIVPTLLILHSPQLSQRIHMLSILQDPQTQLVVNEQIREDGVIHAPLLITRVLHNKVTGYATTFLQNYFQHFSYQFLFTDAGLPDRYRVPGMGLLYVFELPLLFLGAWFLLRNEKKIGLFLLAWVVLAPVGSALTYDDIPNLQRTALIFPSLSIFSASGLFYVSTLWRNRIISYAFYTVCAGIVIFSIGYYIDAYYIHQRVHRPWYREDGFASLVSTLNTLLPSYRYVEITDTESDPAIFFMFYNHTNPREIQTILTHYPTQQYGSVSFNKYHFLSTGCPLQESTAVDKITRQIVPILRGDPHILYVNSGLCKVPREHVQQLAVIKRTDGTVVFRILKYL